MAVVLTIAFYALSLGTAAALAYLPFSAGRISRGGVACLIAAALIVWSVLPRRDRLLAPGPRLDPAQQPRLFKLIGSLARVTGQPVPADVYLLPDANAWVEQRGRVLGLGFPLLQALSVSQLRAVLLHEFGHFHGGDAGVASWIHRTRLAIARAHASLSGFGSPLHLLFEGYGRLFLRVTLKIARHQELVADRMAGEIGGARALIDGLLRLHEAASAWDAYWWGRVVPLLRTGYLPPLAAGFGDFLRMPCVAESARESVARELETGTPHPYDSHPPLRVRIAALKPLDRPVRAADDLPALHLLERLPELERLLVAVVTVSLPGSARKLKPIAWSAVPGGIEDLPLDVPQPPAE